MKKRLLSILLALSLALALLPGTALAASNYVTYPVTGGNIYFDPATGTIVHCDEIVTAAVIPSEIGGVPVTSIGQSAFHACTGMISVVIPDSVTSIELAAFQHCDSLTSVVIPNSVTSIGQRAFSYCGLTSVKIPASVTSIGGGAFGACDYLAAIEVDAANPSYRSSDGVLFDSSYKELVACPGSKTGSYRIPDGVTSIGDYAFLSCRYLTGVELPNSVTSIGERAFSNCSSLTGIVIPASVTSIGAGALVAGRLAAIEVDAANPAYTSSDGVLYDKAFTQVIACPPAKTGEVRIPDGVTSIAGEAFAGCYGLTGVEFPDSVAYIGDSAFNGCSRLTSVTIPDGVTYIGTSAFNACRSLTSVVIPDSITSIMPRTFNKCTGLTSVTIPASVTSIEHDAFDGCDSLQQVTYSGTEAQWNAVKVDYNNDPLLKAKVTYSGTSSDTPSGPSFNFDFKFGGLDPQTGDLKMSIVVYMNGIELLTIPLTLHLG